LSKNSAVSREITVKSGIFAKNRAKFNFFPFNKFGLAMVLCLIYFEMWHSDTKKVNLQSSVVLSNH